MSSPGSRTASYRQLALDFIEIRSPSYEEQRSDKQSAVSLISMDLLDD
jgi:hypothetical protein